VVAATDRGRAHGLLLYYQRRALLAPKLRVRPEQLLTQLDGVLATAAWCGIATFVLLRLVGLGFPLRASPEDELAGLDISLHGEALQ
jgi:ammonia channel protein AmtB